MSSVEADFLAACAEHDRSRAVRMIDEHWPTLLFSPETFEHLTATVHGANVDDLLHAPRAGLIAEVVGRLPVGSVRVALPGTSAQVEQALRDGHARTMVEVATLGIISRRAGGHPLDALVIARASRPLVRASSVTRFSAAADLSAYWHLQAGQAAFHAGNLEQALLDFRHAWTLRGVDVTGYVATSTAPFLALLAALSGDAVAVGAWQAEVDSLEPQGRSLIEWDTMERPALIARLLGAADRLDLTVGEELTELLLPRLAFDETWPITLVAITRHLVNAGAAERAQHLIEATVELHTSAPATGTMHSAFVTLALADATLALGRRAGLDRLLARAEPALLPGPRSLYAVHLALLAGDLPTARRLAALAEHQATDERVLRESRFLGAAIGLDLPGGEAAAAGAEVLPLPPALRRTASLLPPAINARLGSAYTDVPRTNRALADATTVVVRLTPAEARVLSALRRPGGLPEIADGLHISRNTLKTHLRALYGKLGASSRDEALALAGRHGLLDDDVSQNDEGPPP